MYSYDEKGVDANGKWAAVFVNAVVDVDGVKVSKRSFRTTTGEKSPFWTTVGLWTRADGQCPVDPIVVHQSAKMNLNFTENLSPMTTPWCNKSGGKLCRIPSGTYLCTALIN